MAVRFFNMPKSTNEPASPSPSAKEMAARSTTTTTDSKPTTAHLETIQQNGSAAENNPPSTLKPSSTGLTFSNQDSLPRLPIPDLEATCKKYLDTLAPLQTGREHEDTKAAVAEFLRSGGPELQERLKKYATSKSSYIEQFWYDSFLNYDNPVVLNLNPFFLLEDDPTPARNHQVTRAASLVTSSLAFVRAVRKEELPPDTVRGTPLCMYQYSRLFGTARVPTDNGCIIGQDSAAKHMVVLCRGQFYWFDVLDSNNDLIMTERDLALNLQAIIQDAEQTSIQEAAKGALGVLSTENRKIWSGLRDILTKDEGSNNAECLNIVDSALFILCLDYTEPSNVAELCGNMLCGTSEVVQGVQIGTCTNRWYDKLQIIVCKNGSAGINFEHTGVDGHTVLRFASDVYTDTILRFARTINGQAPSLWKSTSPDPAKRDPKSFGNVSTTPHKLEWDMGPELSTALRFAESHLADLLQQHEFEALDFTGYGKSFMTSMGFSPDAFVQMAFQAAYYGLYGRIENTYEPAMTKVYLHGRTEAIRTVSPESVDFVKTFWGDNPALLKVDALRKAAQKHVAVTKECAKAQGQDRHLYALCCLWQRSFEDGAASGGNSSVESNGYSSPVEGGESVVGSPRLGSTFSDDGISSTSSGGVGKRATSMPTPAIFNDAGWDKINNTIISTSNCGNPSLRHFGFGPTSGDGFGIGYIIKDESISICASSKHRQTKRFIDTLESYLLEIRKLLRATQKGTSPRTSRAREAEAERVRGASGGSAGAGRVRGRGKIIRPDVGMGGAETPTTDGGEMEDDGMGGYGFFDAGMLLHALRGMGSDRDRGDKPAKRRPVGKKLKLNEY
ncbi:hypothetical protein FQN54_008127 [Arachnomyces sp. PD_36]|nr:hypothetical protein FQN54_008127 [Arachnomyces sp. PD_36]